MAGAIRKNVPRADPDEMEEISLDKPWEREVKSSALGKPHSGLNKFQNHWPEAKAWIVGPDGQDLAEFLSCDLTALFAGSFTPPGATGGRPDSSRSIRTF
ncbi:MAG: hypothetical protein U5L00_08605 [Desulfovermiculus sp.]|nr:hypothetical protein [Desulfovermiculus sp.]